MRACLIFLLTLAITANHAFAQRVIPTTDTLKVIGEVQTPVTFTLSQLDTFLKDSIPNQIIFNHNGEVKDTLTGLMGVPLKKVLQSVVFNYEKPKHLNEFYFVLTASDGYKVVLSWNEIYNTEVGNHFYIVTQMGVHTLSAIPQRIVFISAADLKAGRRYVKGLSTIEVKRVQ